MLVAVNMYSIPDNFVFLFFFPLTTQIIGDLIKYCMWANLITIDVFHLLNKLKQLKKTFQVQQVLFVKTFHLSEVINSNHHCPHNGGCNIPYLQEEDSVIPSVWFQQCGSVECGITFNILKSQWVEQVVCLFSSRQL